MTRFSIQTQKCEIIFIFCGCQAEKLVVDISRCTEYIPKLQHPVGGNVVLYDKLPRIEIR